MMVTNLVYDALGDSIAVISGTALVSASTIYNLENGGPIIYDSSNGDYYAITGYDRSRIAVISGTTNQVIDTILLPYEAFGIDLLANGLALDPTNNILYVSEGDGFGFETIDATTNTPTAFYSTGSIYTYSPGGLAFDPSNNILYVSLSDGTIDFFNTMTNSFTGSASTGATNLGQVAYDSSNGNVYVSGSPSVYILNTGSNSVSSVSISGPKGVAVNPSNGNVFAPDSSGNLNMIDATNSLVTSSFFLGIGVGVINGFYPAINPSTNSMYVPAARGTDSIIVVNYLTNTITGTLPIRSADLPSPQAAAFDPTSGDVLVTDLVGIVSIISTSSTTASPFEVIAELASQSDYTYGNPDSSMAFDPDNGLIYTETLNNAIVAYDHSTFLPIATITGVSTTSSCGMVYDPHDQLLYVVDGADGKLTTIDTTTNTVKHTYTSPDLSSSSSVDLIYDNVGGDVYLTGSTQVIAINAPAIDLGETTGLFTPISAGTAPYGLTLVPSGDKIYVADYGSFGSYGVSVIQGSTNTLSTTINLNERPTSVAFDSINGLVYVATDGIGYSGGYTYSSPALLLLDPSSNTITGSVSTALTPSAVEIDSSGDIFVVNQYSGNVWAISPSTGLALANLKIAGESNPGTSEVIAFDSVPNQMFVVGREGNIMVITTLAASTPSVPDLPFGSLSIIISAIVAVAAYALLRLVSIKRFPRYNSF